MKVHLKQIPPEGRHYEGEESPAMLDLHDPEIIPLSAVGYSLDVGLSDGGLFATGALRCDIEFTCVNCLERFTLPVRVEDFACQVELTGPEEIDLTEPVREDILLALPSHPRCDWSGVKVCTGVHRPGDAPPTEPEAGHRDVWGALDQLKLQ
jgi:uncharacterized metal-binding protein YceD (DUF177 family)